MTRKRFMGAEQPPFLCCDLDVPYGLAEVANQFHPYISDRCAITSDAPLRSWKGSVYHDTCQSRKKWTYPELYVARGDSHLARFGTVWKEANVCGACGEVISTFWDYRVI